jgi:hypothetical protein
MATVINATGLNISSNSISAHWIQASPWLALLATVLPWGAEGSSGLVQEAQKAGMLKVKLSKC